MGSLREVWLPRMLTLQQFWPDCRLALPGLKTDSTFRNSCSCGSYGAARSTDSQLVLATLRWEHHSLGRGLVGHSSAVPHPGYTGMRYNGAGLSPNTLTNQTSFLLVLYQDTLIIVKTPAQLNTTSTSGWIYMKMTQTPDHPIPPGTLLQIYRNKCNSEITNNFEMACIWPKMIIIQA